MSSKSQNHFKVFNLGPMFASQDETSNPLRNLTLNCQRLLLGETCFNIPAVYSLLTLPLMCGNKIFLNIPAVLVVKTHQLDILQMQLLTPLVSRYQFYSGSAKWLLGANVNSGQWPLKFWGVIWPKDSLMLRWTKKQKNLTLSQFFRPKYCFIPEPDWQIWCRFSQGFQIWS